MPRRLAAVVAITLAAACSGTGETTTTTAGTVAPGATSAQEAVRSWIGAVSTGRYQDASDLVPDDQLVVIIGIENGLGPAAIATMAEAGVAAETLRDYWAGFEASFAEASGLAVTALDVGEAAPFETADGSYAAVEIFFPERIGDSEIIVVERPGGWQVDLMAVIGPSLVRQMRSLLIGLPQTIEGDVVRSLLHDMTPSLRAALARPGVDALPLEYRAELVQLVGFLDS